MLASPWPRSSRSRSPVRCDIRSTATAESSDSTLATAVTVSTAARTARGGPCGRSGTRSCGCQAGRSTRASRRSSVIASVVAAATAASGPGTLVSRAPNSPYRPGSRPSRGQPSSTAAVTAPTTRADGCGAASWLGRASRLARDELCGEPPRTTCNCAIAMARPTPASMPCTMAGETASAVRATRLTPSRSWSRPAASVMAQVACQPYWVMRPAVITVSAAEGPLTCSGVPPNSPTTMPPTAAAARPAVSGAPVARAMPRENGTAMRKTTREAERSCAQEARGRRPGGAWSVVSEAMGALEMSRVMGLPVCPGERTQSGPAVSPVMGSVERIGCRGSRRCGGMAWTGRECGCHRPGLGPSGAPAVARRGAGRSQATARSTGTDADHQDSVNRG